MSLLTSASFTVEDGTGLSDATSYVTVAEAKNYLANITRPADLETYASETDEAIQTYLNTSALFMDTNYCFLGEKKEDDQGLAFPRDAETTVPDNVKYAQIEVSLLVKNNKIYQAPGESESAIIEERVGPIVTKFEVARNVGKGPKQVNLLSQVEKLLGPFLASTQGGFSVPFLRG